MSSLNYEVVYSPPSSKVYCQLRAAAGMGAKTIEAAERGLKNSLFAVQILVDDCPIAMGRVVGDGGCFYQITDIAVMPAYQGKGLGKRIMREIMDYLEANAPKSAYVSLIADGQAHQLYAQYGFRPTAPVSIGMYYKK